MVPLTSSGEAAHSSRLPGDTDTLVASADISTVSDSGGGYLPEPTPTFGLTNAPLTAAIDRARVGTGPIASPAVGDSAAGSGPSAAHEQDPPANGTGGPPDGGDGGAAVPGGDVPPTADPGGGGSQSAGGSGFGDGTTGSSPRRPGGSGTWSFRPTEGDLANLNLAYTSGSTPPLTFATSDPPLHLTTQRGPDGRELWQALVNGGTPQAPHNGGYSPMNQPDVTAGWSDVRDDQGNISRFERNPSNAEPGLASATIQDPTHGEVVHGPMSDRSADMLFTTFYGIPPTAIPSNVTTQLTDPERNVVVSGCFTCQGVPTDVTISDDNWLGFSGDGKQFTLDPHAYQGNGVGSYVRLPGAIMAAQHPPLAAREPWTVASGQLETTLEESALPPSEGADADPTPALPAEPTPITAEPPPITDPARLLPATTSRGQVPPTPSAEGSPSVHTYQYLPLGENYQWQRATGDGVPGVPTMRVETGASGAPVFSVTGSTEPDGATTSVLAFDTTGLTSGTPVSDHLLQQGGVEPITVRLDRLGPETFTRFSEQTADRVSAADGRFAIRGQDGHVLTFAPQVPTRREVTVDGDRLVMRPLSGGVQPAMTCYDAQTGCTFTLSPSDATWTGPRLDDAGNPVRTGNGRPVIDYRVDRIAPRPPIPPEPVTSNIDTSTGVPRGPVTISFADGGVPVIVRGETFPTAPDSVGLTVTPTGRATARGVPNSDPVVENADVSRVPSPEPATYTVTALPEMTEATGPNQVLQRRVNPETGEPQTFGQMGSSTVSSPDVITRALERINRRPAPLSVTGLQVNPDGTVTYRGVEPALTVQPGTMELSWTDARGRQIVAAPDLDQPAYRAEQPQPLTCQVYVCALDGTRRPVAPSRVQWPRLVQYPNGVDAPEDQAAPAAASPERPDDAALNAFADRAEPSGRTVDALPVEQDGTFCFQYLCGTDPLPEGLPSVGRVVQTPRDRLLPSTPTVHVDPATGTFTISNNDANPYRTRIIATPDAPGGSLWEDEVDQFHPRGQQPARARSDRAVGGADPGVQRSTTAQPVVGARQVRDPGGGRRGGRIRCRHPARPHRQPAGHAAAAQPAHSEHERGRRPLHVRPVRGDPGSSVNPPGRGSTR